MLLALGNKVLQDRREMARLRAALARMDPVEVINTAPPTGRHKSSPHVEDNRHASGAPGYGPERPETLDQQVEAPPPRAEPASEEPWLTRFDRSMDREFNRIEARLRQAQNHDERAILEDLQSALLQLDGVWGEIDAGGLSEEERKVLVQKAQDQMGDIIRLGAMDRNQRLKSLASSFGITNEYDIVLFNSQVDQIVRETHLDWATLFSRGF